MRWLVIPIVWILGLVGCSLSDLDRFFLSPDGGPDAPPCGREGLSCCGTQCDTGFSCAQGSCVACGAPGQPCCDGSCGNGAICSAARCTECGGDGQPCCSASTCAASSLQCAQGSCRSCVNSLSSGGGHACALRIDGSLWCWGYNSFGELGTGETQGTTTNSSLPLQVLNLANVAKVAAGDRHTCAVLADATVWCWGDNSSGQLGRNGSQVSVPVSVGIPTTASVASGVRNSCARTTDGSAWCWGDQAPQPQPQRIVDLLQEVRAVAAGGFFACASKNDGSLWCWGGDTVGQLGNGQTSATPIGSPQRVVDESGNPIDQVAEIAGGAAHACALRADGAVWCWGSNMYAQLGTGDHMDRSHATIVLSGARHISASISHTCAAKVDGTLWCWGNNMFGQLGTGDTSERTMPVMLNSIASVVEVSAGGSPSPADAFTCARKADGSVWCWGANQFGELGDGVTDNNPVTSPVAVMLACP